MTPEEMRHIASNWSAICDTKMRDFWIMTAELSERLDKIAAGQDKIIALLERENEGGDD